MAEINALAKSNGDKALPPWELSWSVKQHVHLEIDSTAKAK